MAASDFLGEVGLISLALLVALVLGSCLQTYAIQRSLGLNLSFPTVCKSTLRLIATRGPWIPFLQNPPSS